MIPEINKIYILSAPPACEGMTPGDDHFLEATMNGSFVKMKKIDQGEYKSFSKIFRVKELLLQAVIFTIDLPDSKAKKRLNDKVALYLKNAHEAGK